MDLIDRLREYASTRKGELAELITEAADALERQSCEDAISRQAAIDAVSRGCQEFRGIFAECEKNLNALPAVQPQPEIIHCEDCKYCQREDYDVWISKEVYDTRTSFWCSKLRDVDQREQIEVMLDDYCSWAERRTDGT